ncbi:hypothetical protein K474DRAFT_1709778 [Panus rudis PR-1116 ss-1]|nr:hypothetical protein K474DRAFT_1709778 [Panus rudis PR-1116 ss-1]
MTQAWKRDLIDANESFSLFADRCAEGRCEFVNGYTAGKYAQFFMRKVKSNLAWTRSIMNGWRTAFDADLVDNPTLEKFAQVMHNATQVSSTSVTPLDYYNWMQQFDYFMNEMAKNSGMTTIFAISCGDHGSNPNAWIEPERQIGRDAVAQAIHNVTKAVPLMGLAFPHARYLCHLWPERAVERLWTGQYRVRNVQKLADRVLVIGSTLNPLNSIQHAREAAKYVDIRNVNEPLKLAFVEQDAFSDTFGPHYRETEYIISKCLVNGTLPRSSERKIGFPPPPPRWKVVLTYLSELRVSSSVKSFALLLVLVIFRFTRWVYRTVKMRQEQAVPYLPILAEKTETKGTDF